MLLAYSTPTTKPLRTIKIGDKDITFLCDSGAETSVLTTEVPGMWPASKTICVKSANGQISEQKVSRPLMVIDETSGVRVKLPFTFIPECPVNLLGQDGMRALKISLVPVKGGMRAIGPGEKITDQIFVRHTLGVPHTYWTLDMPQPDPTRTGQEILSHVTPRPKQIIRAPDELHMTLRYAKTAGPDKAYESVFNRLGPQRVTMQYLYQDERGNAAVSVGVPIETRKTMGCGQIAHISLAKTSDTEWKQLGRFIQEVNQITDWIGGRPGWQKHGNVERRYLGFVVTMTPRTHLDST